MADCVVDASIVHFANTDLAARRPGNVADRRLQVLEQVAGGLRRVRYNQKLLGEYQQLVQERRNDVIEVFFLVLDSSRAVRVSRSTLSRQDYATARCCRWPAHDQHLLAAAIGGDDPSIVVTEGKLARCGAKVLRHFAVHLEHIV